MRPIGEQGINPGPGPTTDQQLQGAFKGAWVTLHPNTGMPVTLRINTTGPVLVDGFGGWEVVDRPRRLGIVRFKGKNPLKQDIPFMFEGFIDEINQEPYIQNLMAMDRQNHPGDEPAKITLTGQAHRKDLTWVIDDIDWDTDTVVWDQSGEHNVRIRQWGTLHLMQFVDDVIITTASSPAVVSTDGGRKTVVVNGLTMKQVAQLEYGNPDYYFEIAQANRWLDPDPRKPIPNGTHLTIPYYKGKGGFTYTVGGGAG